MLFTVIRGTIGAGTNRMNVYVIAKASQGLANYLNIVYRDSKSGENASSNVNSLSGVNSPSVVIGYDSRIKSDVFAKTAASVFAANGVHVYLWPELNPVPTVSFATRELKASAGVMITASHNPSKYNGYKVYGPDGCQITTEAAAAILAEIEKLDIFVDVKMGAFDAANVGLSDDAKMSASGSIKIGSSDKTELGTCDNGNKNGVLQGEIEYIDPSVLTSFIEQVKGQSVLFGDEINRDVAIVYSPLNGTGLKPVTRALQESGFTNITVVEEQKNPDGNFPTCPYPNPEIREAMELGLEYCKKTGADLLLATDPDADRCGIAVKVCDCVEEKAGKDTDATEPRYQLLSGNEVGLLLLDYICSQRVKHGKMPEHPVFIKTIVTTDLAEKIAKNYGVKTINVLTGFKFIGEQIGRLEAQGRAADYICGFEESYGYLTGSYVRDKDAVNAAYMICEMLAYYKTRGISLLGKLAELYDKYGYCLNTLHSFEFPGSSGMQKMNEIMQSFRKGIDEIAGMKVTRTEDYIYGLNELPKSDVIKFFYESEFAQGSVVIRPSGTEPKLKVYISVNAINMENANTEERLIKEEIERKIKMQFEKNNVFLEKTSKELSDKVKYYIDKCIRNRFDQFAVKIIIDKGDGFDKIEFDPYPVNGIKVYNDLIIKREGNRGIKEEYSFNISGSEFLYFSGENRKFIANHSSNDEEIILATLGGICSFLSD